MAWSQPFNQGFLFLETNGSIYQGFCEKKRMILYQLSALPIKPCVKFPTFFAEFAPDFAPLPDAFADNLQTSCPIPIRNATAKQMVQRLKPSKEKLMFHFFKKASKKKRKGDMKQEYVVRRHSHFDRFDHNPHLTRNTSSLAHLITSFGAHTPQKKRIQSSPGFQRFFGGRGTKVRLDFLRHLQMKKGM